MVLRGRPLGGRLLRASMVIHKVGGAPGRSWVRTGCLWKNIRKEWLASRGSSLLRLEIGSLSIFGLQSGAENVP